MLAVLSALVFLLALLHVQLGDVDMTQLGLLLLAAYFAFPWAPWDGYHRGPAGPRG